MPADSSSTTDYTRPPEVGLGLRPPPGSALPEPAHARSAPSLAPFLGPSYWPVWLLWLWMRIVASLPLRFTVRLHLWLGGAIYRILPGRGRIVRRNLELCFPQLSTAEVDALALRHFEAVGASFAETAIAWFGSPGDVEKRFRVIGAEHLHQALQAGRGVILFTGHFTPLEICGRAFKSFTPHFTCMFSRRHNRLLDEMQRRGRMRSTHESIASDDVRGLLRSLRRNAAVWYAPDQLYRGNNACLVPFFHELAMTNIATSKLARISGAAVLPFFYRRCADFSYELRFGAPLDDFPSDDAVRDTGRLVELLEQFIELCPEQYLWLHKRFKGRPSPLQDLYRGPLR